jgi:hypothetical protein
MGSLRACESPSFEMGEALTPTIQLIEAVHMGNESELRPGRKLPTADVKWSCRATFGHW